MTGSRITGFVSLKYSRKQSRAQIWNAISELSTSWYEPSLRITFSPTTG